MMKPSRERGAALLLVLGFLAILMISSAAVFTYLNSTVTRTTAIENRQVCLNLAEAGIEKALAQLAAGRVDYRGETDAPLGDGFFSVDVAPQDPPGAVRITATGYMGEALAPRFKASVVVDARVEGGGVRIVRWQEVRGS